MNKLDALIEEFMWNTKGDMHNLAGQYVPAFTDKVEKRLRTLLQSQADKYEREKKIRLEYMDFVDEMAVGCPFNIAFDSLNTRLKILKQEYGVDLSE
jgi:hypothetical protein